ncbi:MAG: PaaI family thioesterase [Jatrophihabitans sp.]|nr:MAG: PaaI family thioesterase [Jatrophihabitans sp.]
MSPVQERPVLSAQATATGIDAATAAVRRVIESLLNAGSSAADLSGVAARLNAIADELAEQAPPVDERIADMWRGEGVTRHDPVTGPENAIAPPMPLRGMPDGSVEGRVSLHLPYQGPPGLVHGGVSALLLDHTLGVANFWAGATGRTGELTLRYHRPTPLFQELTVRGRQVAASGRKIWAEGEIRAADGEVCVSARGLFITPRPENQRFGGH